MNPNENRVEEGRAAVPAANHRAALTTVHTECHEHRQYRLLFGTPAHAGPVVVADAVTRQVFEFGSGTRFGLNLWSRGARGHVQWRCFICEAMDTGQLTDQVPRVDPGARVLLHTQGAAQSRLFLAWFARQSEGGLDPNSCPAALFEAAHFRLHGLRPDRAFPWMLGGLVSWR